MDIKKAFDTVSYTLLLQKLNNYGIRGIILEIFKYIKMIYKKYINLLRFNVAGNLYSYAVYTVLIVEQFIWNEDVSRSEIIQKLS